MRRYPGAAALSEDLRRYGENLPVSARPDTLPYRTGKFIGRNKVGVAAAALLMLALVGGLVATTWQAGWRCGSGTKPVWPSGRPSGWTTS